MSLIRSLFTLLAGAAILARIPTPADASDLIDCGQADTRVVVSANSHLDPACTWTRGVQIVASDVVFDCRGARIVGPDRQRGIEITASADTPLANITVRNCYVEGFLNNIRITREGFRSLAEGAEYDHAFSNIVVEDSTLVNSRGVGVFVDGYVTGVTLRNLHIEGSGSSGIYLEAGSKDNLVENNDIVDNGYRENSPIGQFYQFLGTSYYFWGTGREGLSIDGSRFNRILNNRFSGNSYGGIFLYKNCGEYVNQRPDRWFHRRYGADGNLIEGNTFTGESNGVWVGARMNENTLVMDCSDPPYALGYARDYARDNIVRNNAFYNVTYGVRVEDDGNTVSANQFSGDGPQQAVVIGTEHRTTVLGLPVTGTVLTGNTASIPSNPHPYRWIHSPRATTVSGNQSGAQPANVCIGVQPWTGPFVMTVGFTPADPPDPPPGPPPVIPAPDPLPPCVTPCSNVVAVERGAIVFGRLQTPPGDDRFAFRGRMLLPHPFSLPLDPPGRGVAIRVADATGTHVVDLAVPGGAYDPATKAGWLTAANGRRWRYRNGSAAPAGGIVRVTVDDLSQRQPGLVAFEVKGAGGTYLVNAANLPLRGWLVLDPPVGDSGQCAEADFSAATPRCTGDPVAISCR